MKRGYMRKIVVVVLMIMIFISGCTRVEKSNDTITSIASSEEVEHKSGSELNSNKKNESILLEAIKDNKYGIVFKNSIDNYIIDIPETLIISYYFLSNVFPEKKVSVIANDHDIIDDNSEIIFIIPEKIAIMNVDVSLASLIGIIK